MVERKRHYAPLVLNDRMGYEMRKVERVITRAVLHNAKAIETELQIPEVAFCICNETEMGWELLGLISFLRALGYSDTQMKDITATCPEYINEDYAIQLHINGIYLQVKVVEHRIGRELTTEEVYDLCVHTIAHEMKHVRQYLDDPEYMLNNMFNASEGITDEYYDNAFETDANKYADEYCERNGFTAYKAIKADRNISVEALVAEYMEVEVDTDSYVYIKGNKRGASVMHSKDTWNNTNYTPSYISAKTLKERAIATQAKFVDWMTNSDTVGIRGKRIYDGRGAYRIEGTENAYEIPITLTNMLGTLNFSNQARPYVIFKPMRKADSDTVYMLSHGYRNGDLVIGEDIRMTPDECIRYIVDEVIGEDTVYRKGIKNIVLIACFAGNTEAVTYKGVTMAPLTDIKGHWYINYYRHNVIGGYVLQISDKSVDEYSLALTAEGDMNMSKYQWIMELSTEEWAQLKQENGMGGAEYNELTQEDYVDWLAEQEVMHDNTVSVEQYTQSEEEYAMTNEQLNDVWNDGIDTNLPKPEGYTPLPTQVGGMANMAQNGTIAPLTEGGNSNISANTESPIQGKSKGDNGMNKKVSTWADMNGDYRYVAFIGKDGNGYCFNEVVSGLFTLCKYVGNAWEGISVNHTDREVYGLIREGRIVKVSLDSISNTGKKRVVAAVSEAHAAHTTPNMAINEGIADDEGISGTDSPTTGSTLPKGISEAILGLKGKAAQIGGSLGKAMNGAPAMIGKGVGTVLGVGIALTKDIVNLDKLPELKAPKTVYDLNGAVIDTANFTVDTAINVGLRMPSRALDMAADALSTLNDGAHDKLHSFNGMVFTAERIK